MTLWLMLGVEANAIVDHGARSIRAVHLTRHDDHGCTRVGVGIPGSLGDYRRQVPDLGRSWRTALLEVHDNRWISVEP
jgi:hypothetical protein